MKNRLFTDKRNTIFTILFSFFVSFTQVIGYNCLHFDETHLTYISTFLWILLLMPIIFCITRILWTQKSIPNQKGKSKLFDHKYSFLFLLLLILLAWIPVWISLFPGNFSYDAGTQIRMLKFNAMSKYHPVMHTLFLGVILLGNALTSSWDVGLVIHSFLQMMIMASIFSYTILYLRKKKTPTILLYIFLILYMFLPTHSVFSITTTKDILFSGIFNLVLIAFIEICQNPKKFLTKKKIIITIFITFLLISLRNNMLYAFIVFIPFQLWYYKKYWKLLSITLISILGITILYDKSLTTIFHIENGPRVEMFSFVVQQFARTYHKDSLTSQEKEQIEKLFLNNSLQEYNSHISDPVKSNFNTEELLSHKKEYLSLYLNRFKKNPMTFIDSIFDNIYSFFYIGDPLPDKGVKTYIEISCLKEQNNTIEKDYDCGKEKKIMYYLVMDAKYQKIPLLDLFMNMAFYFIFLFFVAFYLLLRKNYKMFFPLFLLILYMGTNLLAPVAIVRYAYPLFTTFPILFYCYYQTKKDYQK